MKQNFIHHLVWTKSKIFYIIFMGFYFFILFPLLILIETFNFNIEWNDLVNLGAFVFNFTIVFRSFKTLQKNWIEFYLSETEVAKNIILNKTCDNCFFALNARAITEGVVLEKSNCKLLHDKFKLKKDDAPTCKRFEEIPEHIRNNFSNV